MGETENASSHTEILINPRQGSRCACCPAERLNSSPSVSSRKRSTYSRPRSVAAFIGFSVARQRGKSEMAGCHQYTTRCYIRRAVMSRLIQHRVRPGGRHPLNKMTVASRTDVSFQAIGLAFAKPY